MSQAAQVIEPRVRKPVWHKLVCVEDVRRNQWIPVVSYRPKSHPLPEVCCQSAATLQAIVKER
jgi:hypothetical protein